VHCVSPLVEVQKLYCQYFNADGINGNKRNKRDKETGT